MLLARECTSIQRFVVVVQRKDAVISGLADLSNKDRVCLPWLKLTKMGQARAEQEKKQGR